MDALSQLISNKANLEEKENFGCTALMLGIVFLFK